MQNIKEENEMTRLDHNMKILETLQYIRFIVYFEIYFLHYR